MILSRLAAVCLLCAAGLMVAENASPAVAGTAPMVVIDPGHPSETSEGRSPLNGTTELEVNWEIARILRQVLEASGTARVVLTRTEKNHLTTNRERAECANLHDAALMIRLHCDVGHKSGYCLYFPDHAGTVAKVSGPSAKVQESSRAAASAIHQGMVESLGALLHDNGIRTDRQTSVGGKQGALTGSIFSKVPVVTVEMVFLDNPADAAFITSPAGRAAMAQALAAGISRWLSTSVREPGDSVSGGADKVSPKKQ